MNKDVIYPSMVIRTQEETINKLEEEVNKQAKAIQIYEKELQRKDNNWNELKKYITIRKRALARENSDLDRYARLELNIITDKIKELDEK